MTRWASPLDALFLIGESPTTVMHVGSLMPFSPPADAGPDFVGELFTSALAAPVATPWNLRLRHPSLL